MDTTTGACRESICAFAASVRNSHGSPALPLPLKKNGGLA